MTFILAEDNALRKKLQGIEVYDQKADTEGVARQVGVWFGQPDQEIRGQSYPYITIEMIDVQRDTMREMRGKVKPEYIQDPNIAPAVDGAVTYDPDVHNWTIDIPIPVNIDYQITTYARHPHHDRAILAQLLTTKLPTRFGTLEVIENVKTTDSEVITASTMRRLDVISVSKRDQVEQAKRLFINAITVRVSSEVVQDTLRTLYKANTVFIHNPDPSRAGIMPPRDPYFLGLGEHVYTAPDVTP